MDMKKLTKATPSIQTLPKSTQANHHLTDLNSHTSVVKSYPESGTEKTVVTSKKQPVEKGPLKITGGSVSVSGGPKPKTSVSGGDMAKSTKVTKPADKQAEAKRPAVGTDADAKKKYGSKSHNNGYTN
jgi:hypothetical protein